MKIVRLLVAAALLLLGSFAAATAQTVTDCNNSVLYGLNQKGVPSTVDATGSPCNNIPLMVPGTFGSPSTTVQSVQTLDPCTYAVKNSVPINVTSATTTLLVSALGSSSIYVCGFAVSIAPSATTAATFQLEYGTGATCGTLTVVATGQFGNGDLTSAAPPLQVTYGGAGMTIFRTPSSNAVCAVSAGTAVNNQGILTYVQQ